MKRIPPAPVREIRWLFDHTPKQHGRIAAIARRYQLNHAQARDICLRKTWAEIPDDFDSLDKPALLTPEELRPEIENHCGRVLNPQTVQKLRAMRALGASLKFLVQKFGLSGLPSATAVCDRTAWDHVPDAEPNSILTPEEIQEAHDNPPASQAGECNPSAQLTALQVRQIRWLWHDATTNKKSHYGLRLRLANQFQVSVAVIAQVLSRKTWAGVLDDFDNLEKVELLP